MKITVQICSLILCLLLMANNNIYAVQATVVRDGSLLFELPDVNSSVVDILPRGRKVETVAVSGEFTEVVLPENGTRGFLRNSSLMEGDATVNPPENMSSKSAETSYKTMNEKMNSIQNKITTLDNGVDHIESLKNNPVQVTAGKIERDRIFPPVPFKSTLSMGAFGGYLIEAESVTAGVNMIWFPEKFRGTGLELEAIYSSLDFERESYGFNAGLIFPFPWTLKDIITPYIAAAGGMEWVDSGVAVNGAVIESSTITGVNLGGGILAKVNGSLRLRADFRTMAKISEDEDRYEGRGYLSMMIDF